MFEAINLIIPFVICAIECVYFMLILSRIPVKVKKTDKIWSIKQSKKRFEILLLVLCLVTIILFTICIFNGLIIVEIYMIDVIVFLLVGVPAIINRIETKEETNMEF